MIVCDQCGSADRVKRYRIEWCECDRDGRGLERPTLLFADLCQSHAVAVKAAAEKALLKGDKANA